MEAQQQLDFTGEALRQHLRSRGITARLQIEIVLLASRISPVTALGESRVLILRTSQRKLASELGATRSGIRDALERLEGRGILRRGPGFVVVLWDQLLELPEVDELAELAAKLAHLQGGAVVGGSLDPRIDKDLTNQPANQPKTKGLPYCLRIRQLFTDAGRLNYDGVQMLHDTCVKIGWITHDFEVTVALVLYIRDADGAKADGIQSPINWLVATLRDGRKRSWPGDDVFERARRMIERTQLVKAVAATGEDDGEFNA